MMYYQAVCSRHNFASSLYVRRADAIDISALFAMLKEMQALIPDVVISDVLLDYVQDIIASSRSKPHLHLGLSPRAGICLVRAAQAWAFCEDRKMVLPEDVQAVAGSVLEHRLAPESSNIKSNGFQLTEQLIRSVPVTQ